MIGISFTALHTSDITQETGGTRPHTPSAGPIPWRRFIRLINSSYRNRIRFFKNADRTANTWDYVLPRVKSFMRLCPTPYDVYMARLFTFTSFHTSVTNSYTFSILKSNTNTFTALLKLQMKITFPWFWGQKRTNTWFISFRSSDGWKSHFWVPVGWLTFYLYCNSWFKYFISM